MLQRPFELMPNGYGDELWQLADQSEAGVSISIGQHWYPGSRIRDESVSSRSDPTSSPVEKHPNETACQAATDLDHQQRPVSPWSVAGQHLVYLAVALVLLAAILPYTTWGRDFLQKGRDDLISEWEIQASLERECHSLPTFAVMGKTGVGKSTFIEAVGGYNGTGHSPRTCAGLSSCKLPTVVFVQAHYAIAD